ncbi:MAG: L,D-transpeptidase family protein [Verrucomicrobia bacterium]|nr:L,D-transpeptidase family protein [Verrucomicrobiota bacterium]
MKPTLILAAILFVASGLSSGFELPQNSRQCLVGIADGWDSSDVTLRLFEKPGDQWVQAGEEWKGRLGRDGLVWGLGLSPAPEGAVIKREGDWRTPAGVFKIGGAWGYAPDIARRPNLPYEQVTSRDLWVEDPASPLYNQHVRLKTDPSTAWEKKQQMRQDDPAHALELFIAHNAPPAARPGAGSSIFFHIWRGGGTKPTAGCTTMSEQNLRSLIVAIDPSKNPLYVILPRPDYERLRAAWKLP